MLNDVKFRKIINFYVKLPLFTKKQKILIKNLIKQKIKY